MNTASETKLQKRHTRNIGDYGRVSFSFSHFARSFLVSIPSLIFGERDVERAISFRKGAETHNATDRRRLMRCRFYGRASRAAARSTAHNFGQRRNFTNQFIIRVRGRRSSRKRYAPCLLENDPPLIISLDSCSTASAPVKQSTTIRKLWGALFCSRLFQLLTAATVHLYLFYFEGNINGER